MSVNAAFSQVVDGLYLGNIRGKMNFIVCVNVKVDVTL